MSFFEDFKRTATDAANKAAKKTEELTSIAKLNIALKSNEAKFDKVCGDIGRMFYSSQRTGDDYTSEIADAVLKADKIVADIEKCQKDIAKLKKMKECPICGKELANDASFCSQCGSKQEIIVDEVYIDEECDEACDCCGDCEESCDCCGDCEESCDCCGDCEESCDCCDDCCDCTQSEDNEQ